MAPSYKQTAVRTIDCKRSGRNEKKAVTVRGPVVLLVCIIVYCTIGQVFVAMNISYRNMGASYVVIHGDSSKHQTGIDNPYFQLDGIFPARPKTERNTTQQCALATLDRTKGQLIPTDKTKCPASAQFSQMITNDIPELESVIQPRITFLMLYYNDDRYLAHQLDSWMNYTDEILSRVRFVIVDDGSSSGNRATEFLQINAGKILERRPLDIRVYEIDQDIDWNIGGARNLGFWIASQQLSNAPTNLISGRNSSSWVFMNDADVLVPTETMQFVLNLVDENLQNHLHSGKRSEDNVYGFFQRVGRNGKPNKKHPHPAVMLSKTNSYWSAGGCDEDFVGNYGWTDPHFFYRVDKDPTLELVRIHSRMDASSVPPLVEMSKKYKESCPHTFRCMPIITSSPPNAVGGDEKDHDRLPLQKRSPPTKNANINHKLYLHKTVSGEWSNEYLRFTWSRVW